MGDLRRGEAPEGSQREGHARLGGERGVAAGEDEPQPVVRDGAVVDLVLLAGGHERLELADLVLEPLRPPDAVDRLVARGGGDPRAGIARQAALGPDLERDEEGVLDGLLGEVEVTEHPDERRDRPPRLFPEQAADGLLRSAYRRAPASCPC
jgi:hypothetical protein